MHTLLFLILSAVLEIAGCWQYYQYFVYHKPIRWLVTGTLTLIAFGWACAQPDLPGPGYIYAAYAGIYAMVAILIWMPLVDREPLTGSLIIGACLYLCGSIVMLGPYLRG